MFQSGKAFAMNASSVSSDTHGRRLNDTRSNGLVFRQLSAICIPLWPEHHIARLKTPPLAPSAKSNSTFASCIQICRTPAWNATLSPPPARMSARFGSGTRRPFFDDRGREAICDCRDREARIRADSSRHHRAVGDVQTLVAEDLAVVGVDDALLRALRDRTAPQWVHRDRLTQPPEEAVLERCAEPVRDLLERLSHVLEIRPRLVQRPLHVEQPSRIELHPSLRWFAPDPEQRQRAAGKARRADETGGFRS